MLQCLKAYALIVLMVQYHSSLPACDMILLATELQTSLDGHVNILAKALQLSWVLDFLGTMNVTSEL